MNWNYLWNLVNPDYFRVHDNLHKHPLISKIMCWMGRHDYEFKYMIDEGTARLQCFYCEHKKTSTTWLPLEQR